MDEYTEPHRWNFSMSIATHQGLKRVPEEIADEVFWEAVCDRNRVIDLSMFVRELLRERER